MRKVTRLFHLRLADIFSSVPEGDPLGMRISSGYVYDAVRQARHSAYGVACLYLRGQARLHGADESWLPPEPKYTVNAVEAALREANGSRSDAERRLEQHVWASARQTVADASRLAPYRVPPLEDGLHDEDLKDFPGAAKDLERSKHKRHAGSWADAFDDITDRVGGAIRDLEDRGVMPERGAGDATKDVPRSRRDLQGRVIARPFGWARVTHPSKNGPCGFCAMLASRGPVYSSARAAGMGVERFHWNCVTGDTLVSGPMVEAAYRRSYEGPIVRFITERGLKLTITPKHPVLTPSGWKPAKDVSKGDSLIRGDLTQRHLGLGPDVDDRPAPVQDVFAAAKLMRGVTWRSMPAAAEDFHGDVPSEGKVDVVYAHGDLGFPCLSPVVQPPTHSGFGHGGGKCPVCGSTLPTEGSTLFDILGLRPASGAAVGGPSHVPFFSAREACHSALLGFGATSAHDSLGVQPAVDDGSGDVVLSREGHGRLPLEVPADDVVRHGLPKRARTTGSSVRFDPVCPEGSAEMVHVYTEMGGRLYQRLTGLVETDRVVEKSVGVFAGHVYNLSTAEGWYSAGGLIVSNCHCSVVPVFTSREWEGKAAAEEYRREWNTMMREDDVSGSGAVSQFDRRLRGRHERSHH
nr:MAG TPA: minor capsid protein [Caudoviricetes sp.]